MAVHKDLIANIESLPDGPQIGALFDFDGTLIAGYSAFPYIREQVRRGDISPAEFAKLAAAMASFGLGNIGFSAMMLATMQFLRGMSEERYSEFGEELFTKHIARRIYPESRALVEAHQRKGHTVAIISSATRYQVEPSARDLGIEHVLCTQLEVDEDGNFTGGVLRPTCFGQGKVDAALTLTHSHGMDMSQSYFYSDSYDDIELLEAVGHPRPLNPNTKLTRVAEARGWPIRRFASRGRPGPLDVARSVAATGSLVGAFAASLPIWMLTGSRRDAQNFSFSLFADTASALVGLNLKVNGEHHLWSERPCVFVFNHQSKADVIIMARLLRRDIAGIGKKEISYIPVIGQVMQFSGTVFVDRKNARSAIEAMKPLRDVMRREGKSVVIAPEGTRTVSPRLGAFKKGAFHLAMQAGVPIVPIVIHNAIDVAPKGDFVFRRATVEVDILPPVDTGEWTAETMSEHVEEVRDMFLETLGQDDEDDLEVAADGGAAPEPPIAAEPAAPVKKARAKKAGASNKDARQRSPRKRRTAANGAAADT